MSTQQWRSNFYFIVNLPFVSGPLCCQTIQTSYLWWENVLRPISYYIVAHYNGADAIFNIVSKHLNISLNISKTISRNDWWVEVIVLYRGPAQCCTIDKIELTILPLCASFTLQTFTSPLSSATTNQFRYNLPTLLKERGPSTHKMWNFVFFLGKLYLFYIYFSCFYFY